jgi:hypothetical protein
VRSISVANQLALTNARDSGLIARQFGSFMVRERDDGEQVQICLWSGDEDVELDVISGVTGLPETRTFYGGVNFEYGEIVRVSDLTIQSVEVSFSAIAPICKSIIFEHEPRLAKVELHAGWLNTVTREVTAEPEIDFLGEVDGATGATPAVGGESMFTVKIVSDAISMLARKNPRKRSYEAQKRRSGDEFGKYRNSTETWHVKVGS